MILLSAPPVIKNREFDDVAAYLRDHPFRGRDGGRACVLRYELALEGDLLVVEASLERTDRTFRKRSLVPLGKIERVTMRPVRMHLDLHLPCAWGDASAYSLVLASASASEPVRVEHDGTTTTAGYEALSFGADVEDANALGERFVRIVRGFGGDTDLTLAS